MTELTVNDWLFEDGDDFRSEDDVRVSVLVDLEGEGTPIWRRVERVTAQHIVISGNRYITPDVIQNIRANEPL